MVSSLISQLLVFILTLDLGNACYTRGNCPICRSFNRTLTNPTHSFVMSDNQGNTATWTCGYLAQSVALLDPTCGGLEAFQCAISQTWAEKMCTCSGPSIPPLSDHVTNPTPSCNLCIDSRTVPYAMENQLVNTGVAGRMPCGGLYDALAQGILPASMCSIVQQNAANFCCNLPVLPNPSSSQATPTYPQTAPASAPHTSSSNGGGSVSGQSGSAQTVSSGSSSSGSTSSCGKVYSTCSSSSPCCSGLLCTLHSLGRGSTPRYMCSIPPSSSSHQSLATSGGGAAGAAARNHNN